MQKKKPWTNRMLKYLSVAAFINIISKISSIGISEVCNTDSLACFWERLYVLTKKAQVVVTIIFKNKSKNNYKNIVIRRNIDVAKWNRHRDTLSYSVYSIRKSHSGGVSYFAVYNFVGVEVFLFLASKNKCASKWCFCSVICVPVLLRCAGRAQKALVAHSANTPNPGVLIQETCHLRQAYGWIHREGKDHLVGVISRDLTSPLLLIRFLIGHCGGKRTCSAAGPHFGGWLCRASPKR